MDDEIKQRFLRLYERVLPLMEKISKDLDMIRMACFKMPIDDWPHCFHEWMDSIYYSIDDAESIAGTIREKMSSSVESLMKEGAGELQLSTILSQISDYDNSLNSKLHELKRGGDLMKLYGDIFVQHDAYRRTYFSSNN